MFGTHYYPPNTLKDGGKLGLWGPGDAKKPRTHPTAAPNSKPYLRGGARGGSAPSTEVFGPGKPKRAARKAGPNTSPTAIFETHISFGL